MQGSQSWGLDTTPDTESPPTFRANTGRQMKFGLRRLYLPDWVDTILRRMLRIRSLGPLQPRPNMIFVQGLPKFLDSPHLPFTQICMVWLSSSEIGVVSTRWLVDGRTCVCARSGSRLNPTSCCRYPSGFGVGCPVATSPGRGVGRSADERMEVEWPLVSWAGARLADWVWQCLCAAATTLRPAPAAQGGVR